jgi:hypothetical protein
MDVDWMIDSSPNTRSRAKREIEEDQAGRLTWRCDDRLLRRILAEQAADGQSSSYLILGYLFVHLSGGKAESR